MKKFGLDERDAPPPVRLVGLGERMSSPSGSGRSCIGLGTWATQGY